MFELQVALEELKGLPRQLDNFIRKQVQKPGRDDFPKITSLIARLEENMLSIAPPASPRPKYRLQWEAYCKGGIAEIDKAAIKWLCWESDIIYDQRFAEYLFHIVPMARASVIKSLVWSLHLHWAQKLTKKEIIDYTAKQLASYSGNDRSLVKWKTDIITIVGDNGQANFAKKTLLKDKLSPKEAAKEWSLYEFSEYIYMAVSYAVDDCIEKMIISSEAREYLFESLIIWSGWDSNRSVFDRSVNKLLFHPEVKEFKQRLISVLLIHSLLGDPRLPVNRNNWASLDDGRQQFIKWLSEADIHFFFDHVLKKQDPHRRRHFWLNYVPRLIGSRSLLADYIAFQFHENKNISFGRLSGTQNSAAFILDFGRIVAVEFSVVGCVYLFTRSEFDKSIRDMWTRYPIQESLLKNQDLPQDRRVRHTGNWEDKVANILALNNIRP